MIQRRFAVLLLTASLATIAGCAGFNTVQADLATFGEWPAGRAPGSYAFDRLPSQQAAPDQITPLEDALRPALERAGFRAAEPGARPEVLVQVGVRTTRESSSLYNDPIWWRGGFGIHGRPWIGATWVINPLWLEDRYRYQREAAVLLRDAATGRPLYEARVANEGSTMGSDSLIHGLLQATLADFPRVDPQPRTVTVTLP